MLVVASAHPKSFSKINGSTVPPPLLPLLLPPPTVPPPPLLLLPAEEAELSLLPPELPRPGSARAMERKE